MKSLTSILAPIRHLDLERIRGLRPNYPTVAVEMNPTEMTLVRLKRARGHLELEAHHSAPLPETSVGASIFRPNIGSPDDIVPRIKKLLEASGTKPGRISLIVPDNIAKVSLVTLPELPPSKKQLSEVIRFKLKRAIPFRLEDAILSYQPLSGAGGEVTILVALMLRAAVEQYERVFEAAGARPGLVDLCTSNILNLCRAQIQRSSDNGGRDVALLNRTESYFSLIIFRENRLAFYRSKAYGVEGDEAAVAVMTRELNASLSYYQDKLGGQKIDTVYVRSVGAPVGDTVEYVNQMGMGRAVPVDPAWALGSKEPVQLDPDIAQRIAPAVGAAGRG